MTGPDPAALPPPPPPASPPAAGRGFWRNWGDHPVVAAVTVLASLVGIIAFVLDRRSNTPEPSCVDAVGRWDWLSTGGVVAIAEDRGLHWYRIATDPYPSLNGEWECHESQPRQFTFRWKESGFVDSLRLSDDGLRFAGANLRHGFKLSGTRAR